MFLASLQASRQGIPRTPTLAPSPYADGLSAQPLQIPGKRAGKQLDEVVVHDAVKCTPSGLRRALSQRRARTGTTWNSACSAAFAGRCARLCCGTAQALRKQSDRPAKARRSVQDRQVQHAVHATGQGGKIVVRDVSAPAGLSAIRGDGTDPNRGGRETARIRAHRLLTRRSQILSGSLISLQLLMTLCGSGSACESGLTRKAKAMSSCAQRLQLAELADRLGKGLEIGKVGGAAKTIAACHKPRRGGGRNAHRSRSTHIPSKSVEFMSDAGNDLILVLDARLQQARSTQAIQRARCTVSEF